MNQKRAKAIRKYVRDNVPVSEETVYQDFEPVKFIRVPDEENPEVFHDVRTKGTPCKMGTCQRSVCKALKQTGGV